MPPRYKGETTEIIIIINSSIVRVARSSELRFRAACSEMAAFSPSAFYGGNSEAFSESEDDFSDEDNYVAPLDTEESDSTEASEEENEDGRNGGNNQNNTGPRGTDWTAYLDNLPDFDPLPFTVPNPGSQVSSSNVKCELDYFQLFCTNSARNKPLRP